MKLYLFWWAEMHLWEFLPQIKLIEKVIQKIKPKQILLIPFARTKVNQQEPEWADGWFLKNIDIGDAWFFDASKSIDLNTLNNPLIVISGWWQSENLLKKLNKNQALLKLVLNASCIIGESAGAKILWEKTRLRSKETWEYFLWAGLNILKNTIIEPHYRSQKREAILKEVKEKTGMKYGVWIDSCTALITDTNTFPKKYKKIGKWEVHLIK